MEQETLVEMFTNICTEYPLNTKELQKVIDAGLDINYNDENLSTLLTEALWGCSWINPCKNCDKAPKRIEYEDIEEDVEDEDEERCMDYSSVSTIPDNEVSFSECDECPLIQEQGIAKDLFEFFMKNGFNVKKYGLLSMDILTVNAGKEMVFDIFKYLLLNGAEGDKETWKEILNGVGTEESYLRVCEGYVRGVNNAYALYEMIDKAKNKEEFSIVEQWKSGIGLSVENAYFVKYADAISQKTEDGFEYWKGAVYLGCGAKTIVLDYGPNIFILNQNIVDALSGKDYEELMLPGNVLGKRIWKMDFRNHGGQEHAILLCLENDYILRFAGNFKDLDRKRTVVDVIKRNSN